MKIKLLKMLRQQGRSQVNIHSITKSDGINVGMRYGCDSRLYCGLFSFGNTKEQVEEKACKIFFRENIENIRQKYKKYSRKFKCR